MADSPAPLKDALARFVFEQGAVRGALASLDRAAADILACHPYPAPLKRILGELLAATALLAASLKFDGSLTLQLQGDGPVRLLVVECDAALRLRATAQWNAEATFADHASLADLAGGPAHGRLAILLDPRDGGPIYQGIVALEATTVASLIEHYLATSEQIASRLVLCVQDDRVRGLLVQRLPGSGHADDTLWERAAAVVNALAPERLLDHDDAAGTLTSIFTEDDVRLFSPRALQFACSCSAERVENALRMVGREEVESILDEQGSVTLRCEFCNREYRYAPEAARALFAPADDAHAATVRGSPH